MHDNGCKEFYEYYFEPAGNGLAMVCFQFLHEDFEKGMEVKKKIENLMSMAQWFFIIAYLIALLITLFYNKTLGVTIFVIITLLFVSKIINPLSMHVNLWNAQKQALFG